MQPSHLHGLRHVWTERLVSASVNLQLCVQTIEHVLNYGRYVIGSADNVWYF